MRQLIDVGDVYKLFALNGTAHLHVADIDLLPRVDAVEVVHAKWITQHDRGWRDGHRWTTGYRCSRCEGFDMAKSSYCRNCGAKMDLEEIDV